MNRAFTLAIVLAASFLCAGSSTAQAQTQKSYYHGYYFYYYYNGGYQPYALPTAYYYNYPSIIYVDSPPVWFTPPAPAPVVININVPPPVVVTPAPVVIAPAAPVREWKTVYPTYPKKLGFGEEFGNEFFLGKERWKLIKGPEIPSLPSKRKPTELFVSQYTEASEVFIEYHHVGGATSVFKKVSK